jgi:ATP/maltotriose-dependent transcriptional regulator MalT
LGALLWCASPRRALRGAVIASPLVETKLYPPKLRRSLVARPRLSGRLGRGGESRLLLISAPAGFGKTTLLAEWLAAIPSERSVAWLSLDESDRQPASYWTYLITALQAVVPGVGASALPLLQSGQAPIETVLATVLNDLGSVPSDLYLVLDDYHLVDGPDIQAGMAFLLEHLPPQAHLVVSTREDPALPLARLRTSGELVEVRAADLRFTHALAAGDAERAADLVELAIPELRRSRQEATIRGWLDAIPDEVVRVRPVLAVGFIGTLMASGEFDGVEERLEDVERWLEPTGDRSGTWTPPAGMVVVDEGELPRLPGAIEMYRAALALVGGDAPATIDHAQRAIQRAAERCCGERRTCTWG